MLSILIATTVINILVNQKRGKTKANLKLQNTVLLQLMNTGRYHFICIIPASRDPSGLQNLSEKQGRFFAPKTYYLT
jgi:hypothetical protein